MFEFSNVFNFPVLSFTLTGYINPKINELMFTNCLKLLDMDFRNNSIKTVITENCKYETKFIKYRATLQINDAGINFTIDANCK